MEKIIKILSVFKSKFNTGVLDDNRPESEKMKDFTAQEVLPVRGINYANLKTEPVSYKVRNQDGSGSCVAQSCAKMLEVLDTKSEEAWSATPIYSKRSNKPQGGMIGWNALDIVCKQGSAYESKIPSQYMNDEQMDSFGWFGGDLSKDRPSNYYIISDKNTGKVNFDDLVNAIMTYKTAIIYVNASVSKWNCVPEVHTSDGTLRHAVACVDVIQFNGIPFVVIEDSWGKFNNPTNIPLKDGQRALSKAFIERHCYFAGGLMNFVYAEEPKPTPSPYEFKTILEFGQTNNDVKLLQDKLKSLGLFPQNIPSTGYFGAITAKAVYAFQIKYNVAPISELDAVKPMKGGRVGSKTLAKLNEIK